MGLEILLSLRLLFVSRPDALDCCFAVVVRAIQTDLAGPARRPAGSGARTDVVTPIRRFGSALDLYVHLRMLILDGGDSKRELLS